VAELEPGAVGDFYRNELKFVPGQHVCVYVNGGRYCFSNVVGLRVLCPSAQERFLVVETATGRVVFQNWDGIGCDSRLEGDQLVVSEPSSGRPLGPFDQLFRGR